jgi:hypothetical protein
MKNRIASQFKASIKTFLKPEVKVSTVAKAEKAQPTAKVPTVTKSPTKVPIISKAEITSTITSAKVPTVSKAEPKAEPTVTKAEPTVAKAEPTVAKAEPTVAKAEPTVSKAEMVNLEEKNSFDPQDIYIIQQLKLKYPNFQDFITFALKTKLD